MPETSSHSTGTLHEIRWQEICPWLILVKALRVTLMIRVLVLATVGMWMTHSGWAVLSQFLPPDVPQPSELRGEYSVLELHHQPEMALSMVHPESWQSGPFVSGWYWLTEPFIRATDSELSWQSSLGMALYGLWAIIVWALLGGAIARIAALYMTRGETLGPVVALRDAITIWPSTSGAPSITLLFAIALGVPLVMLGWLLRLNSLAVVAGLLWCFVLVCGFMLAVVFVGLLIGWPLMWACLGVERSDAFDGVSRCYAYVYQRPLHLAFFVLVAVLLSFLGEAVVVYFAGAAITLSEWTLSWGAGNARMDDLLGADSLTLASRAINGWKWGLTSLVAAYPLACLWPMAVGIYLLLRRQVDATELDEVTLSEVTQSEITLSADVPQSPPTRDPAAHE